MKELAPGKLEVPGSDGLVGSDGSVGRDGLVVEFYGLIAVPVEQAEDEVDYDPEKTPSLFAELFLALAQAI